MKPKVIFQDDCYRIVAQLDQNFNPVSVITWFEMHDGRNAMDEDIWLPAKKSDEGDILARVARKIALEKLP